MLADFPLLSLVIWAPILGGVLVLFASKEEQAGMAKIIALAAAVITFLFTIPLYTSFDLATHQMQFVENTPWIPAFNINYHLGIDGISMPLILLTSFTTILVVIAGWDNVKHKTAQYMAAFLIMDGLMIGVFAALDSIVLRLLGSDVNTDVPDYRHLGWRTACLRHHQILLVHLLRLSVHAGGTDLHVHTIRHFRHSGFSWHQTGDDRANTHFPRLPAGFCGQGSHVASTHMVTGCPR